MYSSEDGVRVAAYQEWKDTPQNTKTHTAVLLNAKDRSFVAFGSTAHKQFSVTPKYSDFLPPSKKNTRSLLSNDRRGYNYTLSIRLRGFVLGPI